MLQKVAVAVLLAAAVVPAGRAGAQTTGTPVFLAPYRAFERVEPGVYPGTGVGLTVVQKAVQRMGGDVGVRSTPGEGSTFWVLLRGAGPSDLEEPDP